VTNTVSKTISDETLNAIITIESAGKVRAKASTSSASGLFQFIDATWMGVVTKHRPDLLQNRTRAQVLELRFDPKIAIELGARFTEDNQRVIGMNCTGGDLYLAHFLGTADAKDLFRAKPDTPVSQLVSTAAISANRSILLGKTAGEVRAWAARKMFHAGGHDWIERYFEAPKEEPLPEPEPEPTVDDIPDPQDAPETPPPAPKPTVVVPANAPPAVIEKKVEESAARDAEPSQSWLKRKWKSVTGTIGGFLGMGTGFVFDWRLMAILLGFVSVVFLFMIWFMGPGSVREWIRKQVS
jgi:hypothetical protein